MEAVTPSHVGDAVTLRTAAVTGHRLESKIEVTWHWPDESVAHDRSTVLLLDAVNRTLTFAPLTAVPVVLRTMVTRTRA